MEQPGLSHNSVGKDQKESWAPGAAILCPALREQDG